MGPPSPELEKAWDDLYQFGVSKITTQDAELIPWKTVRIPGDPKHYAVGIYVFHQLHCLNMIRKAFHPEYYPAVEQFHIDHCIEHLRQSLICSSDVSLIVWQWSSEKNRSVFQSGTPHTCRNFDKIAEWAKKPEHRLHADEFDQSVHVPDDE
ncbi:hypothetical protein V5O48_013525 [Marasmius crinis-equi]|uniref:Uncharacterized protein n=1 Tax=Marasmius crinis-equi TaxID=585013 RepID=A0ABR3EZV7_9AGAR